MFPIKVPGDRERTVPKLRSGSDATCSLPPTRMSLIATDVVIAGETSTTASRENGENVTAAIIVPLNCVSIVVIALSFRMSISRTANVVGDVTANCGQLS